MEVFAPKRGKSVGQRRLDYALRENPEAAEDLFNLAIGRKNEQRWRGPIDPTDSVGAAMIQSILQLSEPSAHILPSKVVIYFIQAKTMGHIKIGRARDFFSRLAELRCACPDELMFLWGFWAEPSAEGLLHRRFHKFRVRGEWFEPSDDLMKYLKRRPRSAASR